MYSGWQDTSASAICTIMLFDPQVLSCFVHVLRFATRGCSTFIRFAFEARWLATGLTTENVLERLVMSMAKWRMSHALRLTDRQLLCLSWYLSKYTIPYRTAMCNMAPTHTHTHTLYTNTNAVPMFTPAQCEPCVGAEVWGVWPGSPARENYREADSLRFMIFIVFLIFLKVMVFLMILELDDLHFHRFCKTFCFS